MSNPNSKSAPFAELTNTWMKVDTLAGGTDAMRAARTTYLPQHPEEEDENYDTRLSRSTLVNFYSKAIDAAVGRSFSKEMVVSGFPGSLQPFLRDIDGSGSTLEQFGQEVFWNTIHHGIGYIIADYPSLQVLPETLADASSLNARPYLLHITAPSVLAAYPKFENGRDRLYHFRYVTSQLISSDDGLTEETKTVIRAYNQPASTDPVTLTTWTEEGGQWVTDGPQPILGVTEIPVVPCYGWRTGFFIGKPVLGDMADLNIAHWQSLSAQTNILAVSRIPFIGVYGDGLEANEYLPDGSTRRVPFKLSVHKAPVLPKDSKIEWIESSGSAAAQGADDIKYIEEKIAQLGLVPATNKTGTITATEVAIDSAESTAQLKALTQSFEQSLSKALFLLSQFAGNPAPTVEVSLDASFTVEATAPQQPAQVMPMQETATN